MTRPSKRVREQAAMICQIAGSTPICNYADVAVGIGLREDGSAHRLAWAAWTEVFKSRGLSEYDSLTADAEAEALLRSGWSPR